MLRRPSSSLVGCCCCWLGILIVSWSHQIQAANALAAIMPPASLVVVGLNAALQKRFVIQGGNGDLVPGNVHRASQVQTGVGGKGQDVAIALNCLGTSGIRLLQFVGQGSEGDAVCQLLEERMGAEAAVRETTIRVSSPLRTCTSIVGATETTELVEPSGEITPKEIQTLLKKCDDLKTATNGICIMGSMPPGCSSTLYSEIYQRLTAHQQAPASSAVALCVMDSVAGVESTFQVLSGPTIYKVNAQELCGLVGLAEGTNLSETIPAFLQKYQPPGHLQAIALTDGKRPGHLCWLAGPKDWELFPLTIPKLDKSSADDGTGGAKVTLYPIGAGDAVAAGTLAAWLALQSDDSSSSNGSVPDTCQEALIQKVKSFENENIPTDASKLVAAFGFGLSCGSASCLQEENSVLDVADVLRLFQDIGTPQ